MKKLLLALFFVFFASTIAVAQTATITATVTDQDGQTWNNGKFTLTLTFPPPVPQLITFNGSLYSTYAPFNGQTVWTGTLNATGQLLISNIPRNDYFVPTSSTYTLNICPNASANCYVLPGINVNSPTDNLTSQINPAGPRFETGAGQYGYLDVEINQPVKINTSYFNVTSQQQRVWNGTSFQTNGGTGGGSITGVTAGTGMTGGGTTGNVTLSMQSTVTQVNGVNCPIGSSCTIPTSGTVGVGTGIINSGTPSAPVVAVDQSVVPLFNNANTFTNLNIFNGPTTSPAMQINGGTVSGAIGSSLDIFATNGATTNYPFRLFASGGTVPAFTVDSLGNTTSAGNFCSGTQGDGGRFWASCTLAPCLSPYGVISSSNPGYENPTECAWQAAKAWSRANQSASVIYVDGGTNNISAPMITTGHRVPSWSGIGRNSLVHYNNKYGSYSLPMLMYGCDDSQNDTTRTGFSIMNMTFDANSHMDQVTNISSTSFAYIVGSEFENAQGGSSMTQFDRGTQNQFGTGNCPGGNYTMLSAAGTSGSTLVFTSLSGGTVQQGWPIMNTTYLPPDTIVAKITGSTITLNQPFLSTPPVGTQFQTSYAQGANDNLYMADDQGFVSSHPEAQALFRVILPIGTSGGTPTVTLTNPDKYTGNQLTGNEYYWPVTSANASFNGFGNGATPCTAGTTVNMSGLTGGPTTLAVWYFPTGSTFSISTSGTCYPDKVVTASGTSGSTTLNISAITVGNPASQTVTVPVGSMVPGPVPQVGDAIYNTGFLPNDTTIISPITQTGPQSWTVTLSKALTNTAVNQQFNAGGPYVSIMDAPPTSPYCWDVYSSTDSYFEDIELNACGIMGFYNTNAANVFVAWHPVGFQIGVDDPSGANWIAGDCDSDQIETRIKGNGNAVGCHTYKAFALDVPDAVIHELDATGANMGITAPSVSTNTAHLPAGLQFYNMMPATIAATNNLGPLSTGQGVPYQGLRISDSVIGTVTSGMYSSAPTTMFGSSTGSVFPFLAKPGQGFGFYTNGANIGWVINGGTSPFNDLSGTAAGTSTTFTIGKKFPVGEIDSAASINAGTALTVNGSQILTGVTGNANKIVTGNGGVANNIVMIDANGNHVDSGVAVGGSGVPPLDAPGDLLCAHAADTTIGATAITGESWASNTLTYTFASLQNWFNHPGAIIQVTGASVAGYNIANLPIATVSGNTVTVSSPTNPGASGSPYGSMNLYCSNQATDAIASVAFANQWALPASYFTGNNWLTVWSHSSLWSNATTPPSIIFKLSRNSAGSLYSSGNFTPTSSQVGIDAYFAWRITSLTNQIIHTSLSSSEVEASSTGTSFFNSVTQPVNVGGTSGANLQVQIKYTASGIGPITLSSIGGCTVTGSSGQTVLLSAFNGAGTSGATATVTLSASVSAAALSPSNVSSIVITNTGFAATAVSTGATCAAGTATSATGTASFTMPALGGAQGNAWLLDVLGASPN